MNPSPSALPPGLLRSLVAAARLAPSSHNTQPWLFALGAHHVDLIADRCRALPVNDPFDRELSISCACALLNLRVAAAAAGCSAQVSLLPDPDAEDLLARVVLTATDPQADLADAALQPAIAARRTVRQRFLAASVPAPACQALVDAAAQEGATLHLLQTEAERHALAGLVAEGDARQWADPSWRRELAAWMHPRRQGDGLALPALALPVAQAVVRSFDMGHGVAAKDLQLAEGSPLLAVLSTPGDTTRDWLQAGQALQRMLLVGVPLGLQASYLNQPVQVAALRGRLQQQIGCAGAAQLVLRWGRPAAELPAAPRRPLDELLTGP